MKKFIALFLPLFLLVACGEEDDAKLLSEKYRSAPSISIDAEIRAEFSDRSDVYRVTYDYERGTDAKVKVISPATIAGIEATIDETSATLKFKDTVLETGMDMNVPTPMNVIHKLVKVWSFNDMSQIGSEGDLILLVFQDGEHEYRTTFNEEYMPISAEIMFNSKLIMKIDFLKCEGANYDN
ncbi:MAG: hypothetical protein IKU84_01820 [Clostridia bacterium]|nr:hypothetical protein [Clostridia bacterium]